MMVRISNVRPEFNGFKYHSFKEKFDLRKEGRWGPKWLHRLVWVAARNLGMLRHPIESESVTVWRPIPNDDAIEAISKGAMAYLERNFNRNDLVAYTSPMLWHKAAMEQSQFTLSLEFGMARDGRLTRRVMGIPVIILPEVEGCLVVPSAEVFA